MIKTNRMWKNLNFLGKTCKSGRKVLHLHTPLWSSLDQSHGINLKFSTHKIGRMKIKDC